MTTSVAGFLVDDDDGTRIVHRFCPCYECGDPQDEAEAPSAAGSAGDSAGVSGDAPSEAAGSGARLRQAFSSSWNEGRTWPGTARRAISTALMGAVPFRDETIRTRIT